MVDQNGGIGVRLRIERRRLGLTQREFGKRGGVEPNAQSRYERGDRFPNSTYFVAVADLGVDLLFVLTGVKNITDVRNFNPAEQDVLIKFRSLLIEDQSAIMQLMGTITKLLKLTLDGTTPATDNNFSYTQDNNATGEQHMFDMRLKRT